MAFNYMTSLEHLYTDDIISSQIFYNPLVKMYVPLMEEADCTL